MNSVEAKKGFKTFLLLTAGVFTILGAYKGIPQGYRYLTKAGPQEQIKNLQIKSLNPTSITITWETDKESVGFVQYGTSPDMLERKAPENTSVLKHEAKIENLKPQTTYYYKIGLDGKIVSKSPYQFTTPTQ